MVAFQFYRCSTIGTCLTETLDEMVQNRTLTPELANRVLAQFDETLKDAFKNKVKGKVKIKGHLHSYRFCDMVWSFFLKDVIIKHGESVENVERVYMVACDAKLLLP